VPDNDIVHGDVVRQLHLERAAMIEHLSEARAILAFVKGVLEAEKLMSAKGLEVTFTEVEETALERINNHLAKGLFGDR
jgi:hypothetical protein